MTHVNHSRSGCTGSVGANQGRLGTTNKYWLNKINIEQIIIDIMIFTSLLNDILIYIIIDILIFTTLQLLYLEMYIYWPYTSKNSVTCM